MTHSDIVYLVYYAIKPWTKRHTQEIQGIRPRASDRPSAQSTQLGHLSHLDPCYHSRSQKTTTLTSVD
jgi:hypothetical protein